MNLPTIDFMGKRKVAGYTSIGLLVLSCLSLAVSGLNFGLDFTGGTLVEVGFEEPVDPETVAYGMLATLDGLQVHQLLRPDLEVNRIWRESIELIVRGLEVRS